MNAKHAALATAVALLGASLGVTLTPASAAHDDASPKTMYTRHVKGGGKLQAEFRHQKNSRAPESLFGKGRETHMTHRKNGVGSTSGNPKHPGAMGYIKQRSQQNKGN